MHTTFLYTKLKKADSIEHGYGEWFIIDVLKDNEKVYIYVEFVI